MDDVVPVEQVGDGGGECRLGGRVGALIELEHEVQVIAAVGAHAADRLEIAGALRPAVRVVLRADVVALGRGEVADDLPRVVPADGRRTEVNVVVAHLTLAHRRVQVRDDVDVVGAADPLGRLLLGRAAAKGASRARGVVAEPPQVGAVGRGLVLRR